MRNSFVQMILLSVRRRRRSLWKVAVISFLCVFLFAGIMIFQDCMNRFQRENAFLRSGEWILSTEEKADFISEHAWIDYYGETTVRAIGCSNPQNADNIREEGYIGTVDGNFQKLSHLELHSGRMPQKEDEIAITQHVLSDMGVSYQLGQKINFQYTDGTINKNGQVVYYDICYTLSGILKNYTGSWEEMGGLPEFFVVPGGLNQITHFTEDFKRYFYHLDRQQYDINSLNFYHAMAKLADNEGDGFYDIVYNAKSYNLTMWGNRSIYLVMMTLCGLLGSMSLIYLFLMCCNSRRPYYFKLRELGAGSGQVRAMLCLEWGAVFMPSALVGIVAACIFSVVLAAVVSGWFGIPFVFHLTGESIGLIFLYTFGVFIVVMAWCCLFFRVKGLYEMTGQIPVRRLRHLIRRRDGSRDLISLFLRRQKRAEPGRAAAQIIFTVVTMTIFIYGLYMIQKAYRQYYVSESRSDMIATIPLEGERTGGTGQIFKHSSDGDKRYCKLEKNEVASDIQINVKNNRADYGMDNGIVRQIGRIDGIANVSGIVRSGEYYLKWEGQQDSIFRRNWYLHTYVDSLIRGAADFLEENNTESEDAWKEYNRIYAYIPNGCWWDDAIPYDRNHLGSIYRETLYGIQKTAKTDRLLRKELGEKFHSEEFWLGEQSLLFAVAPTEESEELSDPDLRWDSAFKQPLQGKLAYDRKRGKYRFSAQKGAEYVYDYTENTIQTGDKIKICKKELLVKDNQDGGNLAGKGRKQAETRIGNQKAETLEMAETKILLLTDPKIFQELCTVLMDPAIGMTNSLEGGYHLFTSETLLQEIAKKQGTSSRYDCLSIDMQDGADIRETEARVADLLSQAGDEEDLFYVNNIQSKKEARNYFYRSLGMFGVVIVLTGAVYIFICQSMQRKSMDLSRKRLQLFLQGGCGRENLMRGYGLARLREGAWGLVGIPVCLLATVAGEVIGAVQGYRRENTEPDWEALGNSIQETVAGFGDGTGIWLVFAAFWILCNLLCLWSMKKYFGRLQLLEQEER